MNTLEPKEDLLNPANSTSNWDYRKLSDLVKITMGQSPNSRFYNSIGFGIPLIQGNADVKKRNAIIRTYTSLVTKVANPGDILLSVRAPVGEVSKTSFKCCIGRGVCALSSGSDFLYYYLELIEPSWSRISSGTTFSSVNSSQVRELLVPAPPVEEQKAIAQVLSDFDKLIDGLERLIVKKRSIKEGVMQELLRPKEGWATMRLGDLIGNITTGKLDANAMNPNGQFRFYTCAREHYFIDHYAFDAEALLISGNGANVGYIHYYNGKFNAYQRTYVLTNFKIDVHYLRTFLDVHLSNRISMEVSVSNTPFIKMSTLTEMEISFPPEKDVQKYVAKLIGDIDIELNALLQKLSKYKALKLGLMNELLTGKTRLV